MDPDFQMIRRLKALRDLKKRKEVQLGRLQRMRKAREREVAAGNLEDRVRANDDASGASYIPPKKRANVLSLLERAMEGNEEEGDKVIVLDDDDDEVVVIDEPATPAAGCMNLVSDDEDDVVVIDEPLADACITDLISDNEEDEDTRRAIELSVKQFKADAERKRNKIPDYEDEPGAGCSTWSENPASPARPASPAVTAKSPSSKKVTPTRIGDATAFVKAPSPKKSPLRITPTRIGDATGSPKKKSPLRITPTRIGDVSSSPKKKSPLRVTPTRIGDVADNEDELAARVRLEITRLNERDKNASSNEDADPLTDSQVRKIISNLDSAKNIRETMGDFLDRERREKRELVKRYLEEFAKNTKNRKGVDLGDEDSDETDRSDKEEWEARSTSGSEEEEKDDYDSNDDFINDEDEDADQDNILYKEFIEKMSENRLGVKDMFNRENKATKRLIEEVVNDLQTRNAEISDFDARFIRNDTERMKRETAIMAGKKTKPKKKKKRRPDLVAAVLSKDFGKFKPVDSDDEVLVRSDSDEEKRPRLIVKREPESCSPVPSLRSDSDDSLDFGPEFRKKKKKTPKPVTSDDDFGLEEEARPSMAPVRSRILAESLSCPKKRTLPPTLTGEKGDKNNKYDKDLVEKVYDMHAGIPPYEFEKGRKNRTHPEIRAKLMKMGYKNVPSVSTVSRMIMSKNDPEKLKAQETAKRARAKQKRNKATGDLKKLAACMRKNVGSGPAAPQQQQDSDEEELVDIDTDSIIQLADIDIDTDSILANYEKVDLDSLINQILK
jgi:hypothetical protein